MRFLCYSKRITYHYYVYAILRIRSVGQGNWQKQRNFNFFFNYLCLKLYRKYTLHFFFQSAWTHPLLPSISSIPCSIFTTCHAFFRKQQFCSDQTIRQLPLLFPFGQLSDILKQFLGLPNTSATPSANWPSKSVAAYEMQLQTMSRHSGSSLACTTDPPPNLKSTKRSSETFKLSYN